MERRRIVDQHRHAPPDGARLLADQHRLQQHEQRDRDSRDAAGHNRVRRLRVHPRTLAEIQQRDQFDQRACQRRREDQIPRPAEEEVPAKHLERRPRRREAHREEYAHPDVRADPAADKQTMYEEPQRQARDGHRP
jgi:hypothetical protein